MNIDNVKSFSKKLIEEYDTSEIFDDRVEFYGVVLISIIGTDVTFKFCDLVVFKEDNNHIISEIYQSKEDNPIIFNFYIRG